MSTPRELMEKWTPGILGDGSELAAVLAVEATSMLIENGSIPGGPETTAFMEWRDKFFNDRELPFQRERDLHEAIHGAVGVPCQRR